MDPNGPQLRYDAYGSTSEFRNSALQGAHLGPCIELTQEPTWGSLDLDVGMSPNHQASGQGRGAEWHHEHIQWCGKLSQARVSVTACVTT